MPATPSASSLEQALDLIEMLQSDLDQLRDQLAWANRLSTLGTMTAGLAHEFNNLLTPIGSYAQLALKDLDNRQMVEKALNAAARGTEQAGRLVEATLGFASPEKCAIDGYCEVSQVAERSLACSRLLLEREGIRSEIDVPAGRVRIDELALQQVLINLINNARKAMAGQKGEKRLQIEGKRELETFVLDVIDTGPGIPESVIERLFEPFVSQPADSGDGSDDGTPASAGSGLGLSICKRLIEAAGGSISAEPGKQRGAMLRIELPIVE